MTARLGERTSLELRGVGVLAAFPCWSCCQKLSGRFHQLGVPFADGLIIRALPLGGLHFCSPTHGPLVWTPNLRSLCSVQYTKQGPILTTPPNFQPATIRTYDFWKLQDKGLCLGGSFPFPAVSSGSNVSSLDASSCLLRDMI